MSQASNSYAYMPFLTGPRACIGNRFAQLEIQTVLAIVLSRFSVHTVPGTTVTGPPGGLPLNNPLSVRVTLSRLQ